MLDDLLLFVAVAQTGSFSRASAELGVPLSTVSRRIADLERNIGAKLLERTTRQLRLTHDGRMLLDRAEAPLAELSGTLRLGIAPSGTIRATAPPLAARTRLGAALVDYLAAHSDVKLDLITTNAHLDFIRDNIDIAFRIGPLADSGLVATKLWDVPYVICASKAVAEQVTREGPVDLARLSRLPCIVTGQPWRFQGLPPFRPANVAHRIDELELATQAVEKGLGLAYLPADFAKAGVVEIALAGMQPAPKTMYAVYPERRLLPARLRDLIDWLRIPAG
jgi:LysR family transcriptional regulator AphB